MSTTNEVQTTDLDETRRLLYMALLAPRTKRYNLAGTLVNALVHHSELEPNADDVMDRVVALVEGGGSNQAWARDLIGRCTDALDSDGPA